MTETGAHVRTPGARGGLGEARSARWAHGCRFLGCAGVALFFLSAFTPVPNRLGRWLESSPELEPADGIVVLGAGIQPGGMLNDGSLRRALTGILLHRKGLASLLVFFGPAGEEGPEEAEVRATLARALGIPPGAIVTESRARTTREEALYARTLLHARGVRKILLVTDAHHMGRARAVFERAGFAVLAAPTHEVSSRASGPEERLRLTRRMLEECLARLYYRMGGYL